MIKQENLTRILCRLFQCQTVLFDPSIGPNQVLPFLARMDLGAIVMKRYYTFLKGSPLLEPHYQIFCVKSRTLVGRSFTPLQRCSRCILQPQATGLNIILVLFWLRSIDTLLVFTGVVLPHTHTHTHTHIYIYICVCVYVLLNSCIFF